MNTTYSVIVDGVRTSGLNLHEAYKMWREVVGSAIHMEADCGNVRPSNSTGTSER